MNAAAKKWIRALKSGKYRQTKDHLRTNYGFCCLGVACDLAVKAKVIPAPEKEGGQYYYDNAGAVLPRPVQTWLGLRTNSGRFGQKSLMDLNDEGKRFKTIARIIESEPAGLFMPDQSQAK
jgi:hypothetical protein